MSDSKLKANPVTVHRLARLGLSDREIAYVLGIHEDRIRKTPAYHQAASDGRLSISVSIKRKQIELALAGDKTMLVWCGKQYCGQSDRRHLEHEGIDPLQTVQGVIILPAKFESAEEWASWAQGEYRKHQAKAADEEPQLLN